MSRSCTHELHIKGDETGERSRRAETSSLTQRTQEHRYFRMKKKKKIEEKNLMSNSYSLLYFCIASKEEGARGPADVACYHWLKHKVFTWELPKKNPTSWSLEVKLDIFLLFQLKYVWIFLNVLVNFTTFGFVHLHY